MTEMVLQQSTSNKRKITNFKRCKTLDNIYMYKENTIHLWTGEEVNGNIFFFKRRITLGLFVQKNELI